MVRLQEYDNIQVLGLLKAELPSPKYNDCRGRLHAEWPVLSPLARAMACSAEPVIGPGGILAQKVETGALQYAVVPTRCSMQIMHALCRLFLPASFREQKDSSGMINRNPTVDHACRSVVLMPT